MFRSQIWELNFRAKQLKIISKSPIVLFRSQIWEFYFRAKQLKIISKSLSLLFRSQFLEFYVRVKHQLIQEASLQLRDKLKSLKVLLCKHPRVLPNITFFQKLPLKLRLLHLQIRLHLYSVYIIKSVLPKFGHKNKESDNVYIHRVTRIRT